MLQKAELKPAYVFQLDITELLIYKKRPKNLFINFSHFLHAPHKIFSITFSIVE